MGLSIYETGSNGETIERPISHFDLVAAHYGIGETMPLRSVIVIAFSALVLGILLGASIFIEETSGKFAMYLGAFGLIAQASGNNAGTRHQNDMLEQTMTKAPYVPNLAFMGLSYVTAAFAAFYAVEIGGITGFIAGLGIAIFCQINRFAPKMLFAFRIWTAKRLKRKMAESLQAGKNEGLGG